MELREYWRLFKRRWLFVVIPAAIVLVVFLIRYQPPPPAYNVGLRFIVGQPPSEGAELSDEERLANWQTSEYIVNGLTDWVRGGSFAALVSERLASEGLAVDAGAIQGSIAADNTRSMLQLSMTFGDRALLEKMIVAAAAVLVSQNDAGLPQLGGEPASLVQLDQPVINQISSGLFDQLDLPLRLAIALAAGAGLGLLVEYLDPTVRDRQEVETLGLPIMGEIPRK
jgi:capsular polysaccharide biosynthesis protein